ERTVKVRTMDSQLTKVTDPVTNLQAQNDLFRAENDKVKQHYKQLYDSIKITRVKHIEQVTKLTAENVTLKTSVSKAKVQPSVLTRTKHAVDVELSVSRLRNNRDAHLDYLRNLKESVETIHDIVKEAKVVRPLDRSIVSACRYTQHSQELLEYAIGTCPQGSQQRAKQLAHTPLIKKKQVTATKPSVRQDRVKRCPKSSGSQPKSNHKTNRILPAKGANKLPVEDLPRTNKSHPRTTNRVDSSSRLTRTVINSNSDSICQTCNKCLTSFDHDMCVAVYVKFVVLPHSTRHNCEVERKIQQVWKTKHVARKMTQVWKPKLVGKVWKPIGKFLTTIGHQWRPTGQILHLGTQCPLTRFTPPQVVSAAQNKKHANTCANQKEANHNWGSKVSNSPSLSGFKCRGYGDYVVGESVISRVYYMEGLGHNLFSVGQFCDSDLEVALRKHSCYVRDTDGVDLIKGSRGSNLYTILVEDMMKSSLICLLSKAFKNKSWLWHRYLNHLSFGTVFSVATESELNVARFAEMHVANTSVEARCLALKAELGILRDKSHQENQWELIKHFFKLEVDLLNLQLKYQNLKDSIGNHPPTPDKETPNFDSVFVIGKMQASLQGKDNAIRQLKKQLSELQATSQNDRFRAGNDKVKQHYKQLYDSIKITRAKHIEQVTKLTVENVTLKTSVSNAKVQPSVLTRTKHAVDVELIIPRLRNNRDAHLEYLRHLKESVETIHDIVEEAKVLAHTPLIRKKQVTIIKPSHRQDSNKNKLVVTQKIQKTNVPVPHSAGVKCFPKAGGSQPKRNHKTNRISLAKGDNKLPVKDLPRTNKCHLRTTNRVDSNSRLKHTVINSNSDSICQTCNKCLTSFHHDMCVAVYVKSVVLPHSTRHNCEVEGK
nr:integrase, catalytic region, zinc finger, CCHC-type, peptidase aspartic, catalytic [Tanacetum cinerariifolium]